MGDDARAIDDARAAGDYKLADAIRDWLLAAGHEVKTTRAGTVVINRSERERDAMRAVAKRFESEGFAVVRRLAREIPDPVKRRQFIAEHPEAFKAT